MSRYQKLEPYDAEKSCSTPDDVKCRYTDHRGSCGSVTWMQGYNTNRSMDYTYLCDLHANPPAEKIRFKDIQDRTGWSTSSVNVPLMSLKRNLDMYNEVTE